MTYFLIHTLAHSPMPSQIPHTLFDIISLGVDAVQHHAQDKCKTDHTCAHNKMPQHYIVNMSSYFSMNWLQGCMCIDSRQSIRLCPYHMGYMRTGRQVVKTADYLRSSKVLKTSKNTNSNLYQLKNVKSTRQYHFHLVKSLPFPHAVSINLF